MEKVILCYGDSNTWGYNPATTKRFPREVRWTGRLQALLGKEYVVIEEGLNSRTVVWDDPVNGYRSGLSYLIPCLSSQRPVDLVIVMLGTNDTQERFQLNGFNIARSMRRILDAIEISRSGPDDTQSPFGSPASYPGFSAGDGHGRKYGKRLCTAIKRNCKVLSAAQ